MYDGAGKWIECIKGINRVQHDFSRSSILEGISFHKSARTPFIRQFAHARATGPPRLGHPAQSLAGHIGPYPRRVIPAGFGGKWRPIVFRLMFRPIWRNRPPDPFPSGMINPMKSKRKRPKHRRNDVRQSGPAQKKIGRPVGTFKAPTLLSSSATLLTEFRSPLRARR
jgi:hypothetical protein